MINVALIDDHVVVRSGFAQLLGLESDIQIVGQYASAANAWSSLLKMNIDVAVMDIAMPDESGLSVKAIAEQLELSHKTVHVHRANILGKLQCDTTIELVHFAIQHSLLA